MDKSSKIYIAGRNGMAGSSIERALRKRGYSNIIGESSRIVDLTNQSVVNDYFETNRPDYVFLAAAKVGGIMANSVAPAEFLYENLAIQNNVIYMSYKYNVKKLLFLGSSCIYPRLSPQPMKEEYLLDGKLEPTNEGYAIAKIAGLKLCEFFNKQYGADFISIMPCNLYGEGDNFDKKKSHVVAGMIRRFHEAKVNNDSCIEIWGTGNARRELMYVDDFAEASLFLFENYKKSEFINAGTGSDVSIGELASIIKEIVGFKGSIKFDPSKPDGMPRKLLNVDKIHELGWRHKLTLKEGIEKTYRYYLDNILK